jgi:hypothetical protein
VELKLRVQNRQDVLEMMRDRDPAQPELFDVAPSEDPDSGCG